MGLVNALLLAVSCAALVSPGGAGSHSPLTGGHLAAAGPPGDGDPSPRWWRGVDLFRRPVRSGDVPGGGPSSWRDGDSPALPSPMAEVLSSDDAPPARRHGSSFVASAVREVVPSVVLIDTEHPWEGPLPPQLPSPQSPFPSGPEERRLPTRLGQGSGVIISSKGLVLTNAHVVSGASSVSVTLTDGSKFDGKVLGTDQFSDLAVVQIRQPASGSRVFPEAKLGDSDALEAGDWVIAVGSPFGLENTVTLGIVSSSSRSVAKMDMGLSLKGTLIQTDAAINPGNSGGPLCNEFGEVIGINTMMRRRANSIGFAVPINRAKAIIDDLSVGKRITHSFLGITHRSITPEIARNWNEDPNSYPNDLPEVRGSLIMHVLPESAAAEAGLKRFDVVTKAGTRRIEQVDDLTEVVDRCPVGEALPLEVRRQGRVLHITARPQDLGRYLREQEERAIESRQQEQQLPLPAPYPGSPVPPDAFPFPFPLPVP
uniref:RCK C-terminal domain-containing protein n=1 Tax=Rhizochromulina marina TaxID=1034831 RepID=A0A7S2SII2_9STRA|mmetsp:Transcript_3080/g.8870  ORF Transcript_3080/g.8870 Transcript_3080/m.8870 type:complete len:484 (+) Transcript_3080:1-1452(+)